MKRILLSLIAMITIGYTYGQEESIAFTVTNYEINGTNYDDLALNGDVVLAFYKDDKERLCFANYWRTEDSQSYGGIFGVKSTEIPETDSTFAVKQYKFTWKFYNTYDSISGAAAVTFTKTYISNTVTFVAEIVVLDTNEVLVMKGYEE